MTPLVACVAYDGLCTFEFGCVVEMFSLHRPELNVPWYRFAVCSAERGPLRAAGGITLTTRHSLKLLDTADIIILPGWRDVNEPPPELLLKKLRRAHARGARICSICSGAFILAATGLLDGKAATTHWRHTEKLHARFPRIELRPNELYVDLGNIITAAGSAAGLDMLLHLVRCDFGPKIANKVAQRLVVPAHREGGQAQFIPRPVPPEEQVSLGKLSDWVRRNPTQHHSLHTLAKRAGTSARSLQRHFQHSMGLSPLQWLVRERVAIAKEALEDTVAPLWRVAEVARFGTEESFRRHFRRVTGTAPLQYRKQFGGEPPKKRRLLVQRKAK
jgi:AraC family transcriptional regulator, transcriptional activator FtrA